LAFIPVTDTAEVTMSYEILDADIAENVFGVKNTGSWNATSLAALAAVFNTWNDTTVAGHAPYEGRNNNTILQSTTARDLTTQTSPVVTVAYPGSHGAGADNSGPLSNGLTKAFTARTGLSGRSQRGRTFVIGPSVDALNGADPNFVTSAWANDWVGWLNALIAAIPAANAAWSLVVISRFHNGAPRGSGQVTPITTYGYGNLFVDFQRRRAPGHSRHH
jgi:hypothetical protein